MASTVNFVKALWARIPRALKRFLLTGGTAVAIDGASYTALISLGVGYSIAKAAGFVTGAGFAYFAARYWAFDDATDARGSFGPFAVLYLCALTLNVLVNKTSLMILGQSHIGYQISWFVATACSATFNYVGMRFFVFRRMRP